MGPKEKPANPAGIPPGYSPANGTGTAMTAKEKACAQNPSAAKAGKHSPRYTIP